MQPKLLEEKQIVVNREAGLEALLSSPTVAIDIETETNWSGVGPQGRDFGLSFPAPITVVALAWHDGQGQLQSAVFDPADSALAPALATCFKSQRTVVAHNAVFDFRQLGRLTNDITPQCVWDTLVMARLLHPRVGARYDLLSVAAALGLPAPSWQREMKDKRAMLSDLEGKKVAEYGAADARLALLIYEKQREFVVDEKFYGFVEWELRAMREYCRMAARGVRLNGALAKARLLELFDLHRAFDSALEAEGLGQAGSPKARVAYIYEQKGIPKPAPYPGSIFFTDGGALSASTDVIEALVSDHPELKTLANWMRTDRLIGTIEGLLEHAARDGRIHSLVTIGTETGRRSSGHPNVQNLKMAASPDDPAGDLSGLLTADEGFTLVEIDYSNAENWIACMLSADSNLARACAAEDFHAAMAEQYFGDVWRTADKAHRKHLRFQGKRITFGTAYGMGAEKLALSLSISKAEAQALLQAKDRAFPGVAETKRRAMDKAARDGHINLWTGRAIPVDRERAYTAWNFCCQGGVGEMVKRAIVLIAEDFEEHGWKSRVALDMHDAIVLEVAHAEWDGALSRASQIMEQEIVPEKFLNRTTPPVTFVARPDFEGNQKKWGKGQYHPKSENVAPANTPPAASVVNTPPRSTRRTLRLDYPDMDWSGTVVYDEAAITGPGGTRCTRTSVIAYYENMRAHIAALLARRYKTRLPVVTAYGIKVGEAIEVDLVNQAKAAFHWLAVADKCDTKMLIGFDRDELQALSEERVTLLAKLKERLENAERWLPLMRGEVAAVLQEDGTKC